MERCVKLAGFGFVLAMSLAAAGEPGDGAGEKTIFVSSQKMREAARFKLEPQYPATARQFRLNGEVTAEFVVGLDGKVENVAITKGSPMFDAAVISAVKRWSFSPFVVDGHPTKAKSSLTFVFKL